MNTHTNLSNEPANVLDKLPWGYSLVKGNKELYKDGDILEIEKDVKWIKLSNASFLVRKKHSINHELPVYRKEKKEKI